MLTRVALTVLAAGAVTAGATTTMVNGNAPERAPRPPQAEAATRAGGAQAGAGAADETSATTAVAPAADVTPPPCPAGVRNHGAYVSSVARSDETSGAEQGALVSAAARTDCGKPAGDDADDADATAPAETDARAAAKADKAAAKADRKAARESRRPDNPGRARRR